MAQRSCFTPNQSYSPEKSDFTSSDLFLSDHGTYSDIARKCAREVILPDNWGCCGASGDRGFIFPELSDSATRDERDEIGHESFDGCYSLARTCEIAMQDHIEQPYESIVYLVDETIQDQGT